MVHHIQAWLEKSYKTVVSYKEIKMGFLGFLGEIIGAIGSSSDDLERQRVKKSIIGYLEKGDRRGIISLACTKAFNANNVDPEGYKAWRRLVSDTTIKFLKEKNEIELLNEIEKEIQKMPPHMQAMF